MKEKESSDGTLVARARQGDAAAFEALVRRHYRAAYVVALAVLGARADAEDACQDAWIQALKKLDSCRRPERFRHWLLQIARNRARNLLAARRVRAAQPLDASAAEHAASPAAGPGEDLAQRGLRTELERALAAVSEIQRAIVLLHDLEGWTHRAIADYLGVSEVMSRQHLFQARRRMRARFVGEAEKE